MLVAARIINSRKKKTLVQGTTNHMVIKVVGLEMMEEVLMIEAAAEVEVKMIITEIIIQDNMEILVLSNILVNLMRIKILFQIP